METDLRHEVGGHELQSTSFPLSAKSLAALLTREVRYVYVSNVLIPPPVDEVSLPWLKVSIGRGARAALCQTAAALDNCLVCSSQ